MKTPISRSLLVAILFSTAGFAVSAAAQNLLLTVDVSDPAAVTITATTGVAEASDSSHTFNDGIDLATFFPTAFEYTSFNVSPTNLTTFIDGAPDYDTSHSDDLTGSFVDLNLYSTSSGEDGTEDFTMGTQAFLGAATLDLSGEIGNLPSSGTTGEVYAGYSGDTEEGSDFLSSGLEPLQAPSGVTLIGTYQVVPEANQVLLMLVGAAALLAVRRFRLLSS